MLIKKHIKICEVQLKQGLEGRSKINHLNFYFKRFKKKKRQIKPKVSGREIKITPKINEIENKQIEKNSETKNCSFK